MRSDTLIQGMAGVLLLCLLVSAVAACPTPYITSITPNNGIKGASASYTIIGTGFVTGTGTSVTVKLTKSGSSDITATGVTVVSSSKITCTILIPSTAQTGLWNVKVTNKEGLIQLSNTLNNGFTVNKATPTITWATPADIIYGTVLSATQLSATASVPGTFVYTPTAGTVLNAGPTQNLHVVFTPTDTSTYNQASKDVKINVLKATPTITWTTPADIIYGTALSATQLSATASVPGTFVYTPTAGTVLNAGPAQDLLVTFEPTDILNYNTASKTIQITVLKATPTIAWSDPGEITYNAALTGTELNAAANGVGGAALTGTFTYTPGVGTVLDTGPGQALSVHFVPDSGNYNVADKTVHITVLKATPVITWSNPDDIVYGTTLSDTQLNAGAPVPGTFVYNPPKDEILPPGDHILTVEFTPDDPNYLGWTGSVTLTVEKAVADIKVYGYTGVYDGESHGATGTATGVNGEDLNSLLHLGDSFTNVPGSTASWTFDGDANYQSDSGTAAIDITQAAATINVDGYTGIYDGEAHGATGTATGVHGEGLNSLLHLGDSFTNEPGGTANWVFDGDTNYKSDSGTAAIILGKADAIFDIKGYNDVYDGEAHGATGTATGVKGEPLSSLLAFGTTYTDVPGGNAHWTFAGDTNYRPSEGDVATTIAAKPITVTADPKTKVKGADDPVFTFQFTPDLLGSDTFSGELDRGVVGDAIGTYAIGQGTLTAGTNYEITFVSADFTITEPLDANFEGAPTSGQVDSGNTLHVAFTDLSTGTGPLTYAWDFGDGTTSDLKDPSHEFAPDAETGGLRTYNITLTVTDQGGDTDQEKKIQYITVTTQLITPVVIEAVKDVENQLFKEGLPPDTQVSACANLVEPGSCVQTLGCDCSKPPDYQVDPNNPDDLPGCPRVPTCANHESHPALVFLDNGLTLINRETDPTKPEDWAWKAANWEHACQIAYQCPGEEMIPSSVDCKSPVLDCGQTYADGQNPDPGGLMGLAHDPYPWTHACTNDCNTHYALLISGGAKNETNYVRYWNDIQFMYTVLREYGYPPSHIKVLMSDGTAAGLDRRIANSGTMYDSSPTDLFNEATPVTEVNVNADATKLSVTNTLASYASGTSALTPKDSLFIFTTSHGSWDGLGTEDSNNVKLNLWNNEVITDDEFVGKLNAINVGNITMVMEQCYGGGFKDEFMLLSPHSSGTYGATQKRILITASAFNEASWANGFSNAWTTGVAGHTRDGLPPYIFDADIVPKNYRVSMSESYTYGKAKDPFMTTSTGLVQGKEHPKLFSKSGTDPLTKFLTDCFGSVNSITVTIPSKISISWPVDSQHYIFWTEKGLGEGNVKITYFRTSASATETAIATVPASQGYYKWIPTGLTPASDYRIKIATIDTTVYDTSDNSFAITTAGATGNMNINTVPTGATIYMDEGLVSRVSSGVTNKLFSTQKPGDYLIQVEKTDFWPKRSIVTVVSSLTKSFSFTLIPLTDPSGNANGGQLPRIDLNSVPVGAEIFIDGISQGPDTPTPAQIEVSPGPHDVSVKLPNYNPSAVTHVTVPEYDPDPEADNIMVIDTFVLTPSPKTVTAQVLIVPQPLNIGRKGYFLAFVKLPTGYKAADVIAGSVSCEGASALKLVRLKIFPQIFAAIFQRQDLGNIPTGDKMMNVQGEIKGSNGNVPFTGSKIVSIINKKVTTKEDVDSVMTMTDTQIFTKFNKF